MKRLLAAIRRLIKDFKKSKRKETGEEQPDKEEEDNSDTDDIQLDVSIEAIYYYSVRYNYYILFSKIYIRYNYLSKQNEAAWMSLLNIQLTYKSFCFP